MTAKTGAFGRLRGFFFPIHSFELKKINTDVNDDFLL
jgi:hypothetical protein